MTRSFLMKAAHLLILLIALAFAFTGEKALAASIDNTSGSNALVVGDPANLELPGAPGVFYSYGEIPLYFGPATGDLTFGPGIFLSTGNTFYNYTGDPQLAVYGANFSSTGQSVVPEPGSIWLLAAGMLAIALWFRAR